MNADAGVVMWAVGGAIGILIWFVRLEGRVNSHDEQINDVKGDIRYIRDRIDRALSGHHE